VRVLVLENAEGEGPGLLETALTAGGATLEVLPLWRGAALPAEREHAEFAWLVALGGPMAAWEDAAHPQLAAEAALLAARARAGRPTLGICLGAQLLARGLGAEVRRGPTLELGVAPITLTAAGRADPLLAPFAGGGTVMHWHHDTFALPAGAVRLASTAAYENQAFRLGTAPVWGLQFHPECDRVMRRRWLLLAGAAAGASDGAIGEGATRVEAIVDDDEAIDARGLALGRALLALG
jgi:GMP synthase (glutamine-hydrolysing)